MTSRDLERGQKAQNKILQQYPDLKNNIFYHLLDITKNDRLNLQFEQINESIEAFHNWFSKNFQSLDILVIQCQSSELINSVLDCNIYGTIDMTDKMLPLLAENGKIIIVSSMLGLLSFQGEKGKQLLSDPTLTKEKLYKIVEDYRKAGPTPEVANLGFSPKSYFFSKAAINAYTRFILRKQMVKNQLAISVHPGWFNNKCRTDLGTQQATLPASAGAEMIKFVMFDIPFEANDKYNGSFWQQGNQKTPSEF